MPLNYVQRWIIWAGVAVFALSGLFPPWKYTKHFRELQQEEPAGYGFILSPPGRDAKHDMLYGLRIDLDRLIVQWFVLLVLVAVAAFLTKRRVPLEQTVRGPASGGSRQQRLRAVLDGFKQIVGQILFGLAPSAQSNPPVLDEPPKASENNHELAVSTVQQLRTPRAPKVVALAPDDLSDDVEPAEAALDSSTSPFPPKKREWFVNLLDREDGPFTAEELVEQAQIGLLMPSTPVRRAGQSWNRAADYVFLCAYLSVRPDPSPAARQTTYQEQKPLPIPVAQAANSPTSGSSRVHHVGNVDVSPQAQRRAQRIRDIRENVGLTIEEFGNELGVPAEAVEHWERGTISPSVDEAHRIKALRASRGTTLLVGIDGWLIFPAIGMVLSPFYIAFGIYRDLQSELAVGAIIDCVWLSFVVYVAVAFFRRKRAVPKLMIGLLIASLVIDIVNLMLLTSMEKPSDALARIWQSAERTRSESDLLGAVVRAAVWIPYFQLSRRVKATFTR